MRELVPSAAAGSLVASASLEDLDTAFARFLRLDVANGDASTGTVHGYRSQRRSAQAERPAAHLRRRRRRRPARRQPAVGIRAPRDRRAPEDFGYLSEVELALLFRAVPHNDKLKHLGDQSPPWLLGLQGLRTIDIMRANIDDLQRRGED